MEGGRAEALGPNGRGVSSCGNLQTAGPRRQAAVYVDEIHGFDGDRCEPDAARKARGVGGDAVGVRNRVGGGRMAAPLR